MSGQAPLTYCFYLCQKNLDVTRTRKTSLVSCTCQNSIVANMSMISPPAKGRNGLQSYCKFPERPNFWPKIFRKIFRPPESVGSFPKAGAKLLPSRDMAKFFRNFFREIFRFFRNALTASGLQKHHSERAQQALHIIIYNGNYRSVVPADKVRQC